MQAADYDKLAAQLAAKGIKTINGKLIADDTYFDDRRLGYGWEWDSSPYYFQPEISALTVAANSSYDLSALNSVARALSFIVVGALVLVGGFFLQRLSAQRRPPAV